MFSHRIDCRVSFMKKFLGNHIINLSIAQSLDITYDCKSIGIKFYLGCAMITESDIRQFVKGLFRCYELREFRFHSTKLEAAMLKPIARTLDRGCPNLTTLSMPHCRFGDTGLNSFLDSLSHDSLVNLKNLVLTNNFICEYY